MQLMLAIEDPMAAIRFFPSGTSEGDVRIGLYERAMIRRMILSGMGPGIVVSELTSERILTQAGRSLELRA